MNCPSCQSVVPVGAVFCDNCGFDLRNAPPIQPVNPAQQAAPAAQPGGIACPQCRHMNIGGAAFCENCGSALGAQPPAAPVYQQPAYTPPAQAAPSGTSCPACGAATVPGGSFCENCGAPLGAVQPPPQQPANQQPPVVVPPVYTPPPAHYGGAIAGRLVIQGSNTNLPLPTGKSEVIVGREDPVSNVFPEINMDPYGGHDAGVSRQHAKFTMQAGRLMIIDMGGPNGTFVNKQKLAAHTPHPVNNGDELRFGRLVVNYYAS